MKRQEFQDIVHEVAGEEVEGWGKNRVKRPKTQLEVKWLTGGQSGGNCWHSYDETRYYSVDGEPEPEFEELDEILEKICPQITYLQYRKLEKLFEYDSEHQNEYYGNYYIYAVKRLSIEALWNFLVEQGYGEK